MPGASPNILEPPDSIKAIQRDPDRGCADMANLFNRPHDPIDFYPDRDDSLGGVNARRICATRCPIQRACLRAALDLGPSHQWGIWGGTTRKQRLAILRNRRHG